jgi:hypothetical protein
MSDARRDVFRDRALRRYVDDRERAVLPRLVSPRTFLALWLLLGLLAGVGFVAWSTRVPVYAAGPAIVVTRKDEHRSEPGGVVIVFLPAESLPHLRAGQTVYLDLDGAGARLARPILNVEPEISSPSHARRRFALDAVAAEAVGTPAAVVIVDPTPLPSGLPPTAYEGAVYRGQVQIATRRALSLLPLVGALVGG